MCNVEKLITLWDSSRDGNQKSYALLHKELYSDLFRYVLRFVKDDDLADDLLQDLFVKFWINRIKIGHISNVKSYFYTATRSIALNHIRSTQLKESKLLQNVQPDFEFSKEETMMNDEFDFSIKKRVMSIIKRLPERQQEVIYMKFYEGLEYDQISALTGIKYQSVINHVYRAVQSLREVCKTNDIFAA